MVSSSWNDAVGLKKARDDQGEILRPLVAFTAVCAWTCRSLSFFHLIKMTARGWEVAQWAKWLLGQQARSTQ